jgi:hypothetical protein
MRESLPRSLSQTDGSAVVTGALKKTTAEPSVWEKCTSPTFPLTTCSSEALSHRIADKPLVSSTPLESEWDGTGDTLRDGTRDLRGIGSCPVLEADKAPNHLGPALRAGNTRNPGTLADRKPHRVQGHCPFGKFWYSSEFRRGVW